MTFAEKLKKLRIDKNISREQLSKATGISESSISSYELGRRKPKIEAISTLSKYFSVSPDYFNDENINLDIKCKIAVKEVDEFLFEKFRTLCFETNETTLDKIHTMIIAFINIENSENLTANDKIKVFSALAQNVGFAAEFINNKEISNNSFRKTCLDSLNEIVYIKSTYSQKMLSPKLPNNQTLTQCIEMTSKLKSHISNNIDNLSNKGLNRLLSYTEELLQCNGYTLVHPTEKTHDNFITLQLYDNPVSAGIGTDFITDYSQIVSVPRTPLTIQADFVVRVCGDSMESDYYDGDKLLVKSQSALEPGELGIFMYDNQMYFKKFGGDRLISLNNSYNDLIFNNYFCPIVQGKVIGKL